MSTGRILTQSIHSGVFYIVVAVSRLLFAIAVGKGLSSHDYGVYSLIVAAIGLTPFLTLSAYQYYVREVPGRPETDGARLFKGVVLVQTAALVSLVAAIVLLPGLRQAVGGLLQLPGDGRMLFAAGVLLVLDSLATEFTRYLYARKQIEAGNVVMGLQAGLWPLFVAGVFFLSGDLSLRLVMGLWLSSLLLATAYGLWKANPRQLRDAPLDRAVYREAVAFGAPLLLSYLLAFVESGGRFLLAGFYSTDAVGVLVYHYNIVLMIGAISAPLASTPLEPYIVEAHNAGQMAKSGHLLGVVLRYRLMLILPLLAVVAVWDERIVTLLAREEYARASGLLTVLATIPVLGVLCVTFERVLFLDRRTATTARCYLIAAMVQLIAYVGLMRLHPLFGPALALVLGFSVLALLLWREVRHSPIRLSLPLWRIGLPVVPVVVSVWVLAEGIPLFLPRIWTLTLSLLLAVVVYAGVARLLGAIRAEEAKVVKEHLQRAWARIRTVGEGLWATTP